MSEKIFQQPKLFKGQFDLMAIGVNLMSRGIQDEWPIDIP
jgi:hypothetical protein